MAKVNANKEIIVTENMSEEKIETRSYIDSMKIKSRKGLIFNIIYPIFLIVLAIFFSENKNYFLYFSMIIMFEVLRSSALIGIYIIEEKLQLQSEIKKKVEMIGKVTAFIAVMLFFYYYFTNIEY